MAEAAPIGRVRLGVHLLDTDGGLLDLDYLHVPLGRTAFRRTRPGETVRLDEGQVSAVTRSVMAASAGR